MVDGSGPLPDSRLELAANLLIAIFVIVAFTFFTGLDAQIQYIISAPDDYFLSQTQGKSDAVYFTESQIELMNSVSKNSLGADTIGSERAFCGGLRNGNVRKFRVADIIRESDRTSVTFSCGSPFEVAVHSQPGFSKSPSAEDRQVEAGSVKVSCIQYREIAVSPVTGRLDGVNCFDVGNGFEQVPVYLN